LLETSFCINKNQEKCYLYSCISLSKSVESCEIFIIRLLRMYSLELIKIINTGMVNIVNLPAISGFLLMSTYPNFILGKFWFISFCSCGFIETQTPQLGCEKSVQVISFSASRLFNDSIESMLLQSLKLVIV